MKTRHLIRNSGKYYLWHYPELEGKLGSYPYQLEYYDGEHKPEIIASYYNYESAIKHARFFS